MATFVFGDRPNFHEDLLSIQALFFESSTINIGEFFIEYGLDDIYLVIINDDLIGISCPKGIVNSIIKIDGEEGVEIMENFIEFWANKNGKKVAFIDESGIKEYIFENGIEND
jgi:hypothetical protein